MLLKQIQDKVLEETGVFLLLSSIEMSNPIGMKSNQVITASDGSNHNLHWGLENYAYNVASNFIHSEICECDDIDNIKVYHWMDAELSKDHEMMLFRTRLNPANPEFETSLRAVAKYYEECQNKKEFMKAQIQYRIDVLVSALEGDNAVLTTVCEENNLIITTYEAI